MTRNASYMYHEYKSRTQMHAIVNRTQMHVIMNGQIQVIMKSTQMHVIMTSTQKDWEILKNLTTQDYFLHRPNAACSSYFGRTSYVGFRAKVEMTSTA